MTEARDMTASKETSKYSLPAKNSPVGNLQ